MAGRKPVTPAATMGDFFVSKEITISVFPPQADELPVSMKMVRLFMAYGRCANCGAPITQLLSPCKCHDIPNDRHAYNSSPFCPYLVINIPCEHFEEYRKAVRDSVNMHNNRQRTESLKRAGGKATKQELQMLWKAQDSCCYYCGSLLTNNSSDHDDIEAHIDHMQPISAGGSGEIDNLCFTCPRCNLSKNSMSAKHFIKKIDARASQGDISQRIKIRKQRDAYIKKNKSDSVATS